MTSIAYHSSGATGARSLGGSGRSKAKAAGRQEKGNRHRAWRSDSRSIAACSGDAVGVNGEPPSHAAIDDQSGKDGAEGGGDAADVVAEAGAGRAQERGKSGEARAFIRRGRNSLRNAHRRQPHPQAGQVAARRRRESAEPRRNERRTSAAIDQRVSQESRQESRHGALPRSTSPSRGSLPRQPTVFWASDQLTTSGKRAFAEETRTKTPNAYAALVLQTRIVKIVIPGTRALEQFDHPRRSRARLAACHSSGSGTARRIQRARETPARCRRGIRSAADSSGSATATARHPSASSTPQLTPLCSTAAIHGRQLRGQVSDRSEAPTAHSPPMPSAARKRKISRCHHSWRDMTGQ